MGEMLPQQLDVVLRAGVAVMGVVQKKLDAVDDDAEARTMPGFDDSTHMMQQGFNFAPMDVGADRVGEDGVQQVSVLVAHDEAPKKAWRNGQWPMINLDPCGCLPGANRF